MVLLDTAEAGQGASSGEYGFNWRPSTYLRGSPGRADPVPPVGILINEIAVSNENFED